GLEFRRVLFRSRRTMAGRPLRGGRVRRAAGALGTVGCLCLGAAGCAESGAATGGAPAGDPVTVLHGAADALVAAGSAKARTSMEMASGGTRVPSRGAGGYDFRGRKLGR